MNQDLRTALRDLAAAGADQSAPASQLAGRATNRVAAVHRRRRRLTVSAVTLTGVAAAGAAAAAGISHFSDKPASTFPDRPTPSVQAPILTGLQCGAQVADLTATTGPLELGNERALEDSDARVTINPEASSIIPMFLRNTTTAPVTFTTTENPGIYLVRDGTVVAVPLTTSPPVGDSAEGTLAADELQPLLEDRVVACPDADGTTPASIPAGDYDAYGSITVTVSPATTETDVVGGPWKVHLPNPDGTGAGDAPIALPQADPDATFPQCGAILDAPSGQPQIELYGREVGLPLSAAFGIDALNFSGDDLMGTATQPSVVAVRDGVVVGSLEPATGVDVPFDLTATQGEGLVTTASLRSTLCSDPSVPLPAGRYSIWAAQEFSISLRVPYDDDYVQGAPVTKAETYTALSQVATLWMDADGLSVPNPGLAEGWPQNLDEETAFQGDNSAPETVVWLAITTKTYPLDRDPALIASRDRLADLGYEVLDLSFGCQDGGRALGIDQTSTDSMGYGVAVMFSTRGEAETFTARWEPLHDPVVGVVTDFVQCHFS